MTTSQAEKDRKKERDGGGGPKRGDPVSSPEIKRPGKVGKQVSALSFSLSSFGLFFSRNEEEEEGIAFLISYALHSREV